MSAISVLYVGSNNAAALQMGRLVPPPVKEMYEDHTSKRGEGCSLSADVEQASFVRKDETGMIAVEQE
jgi:hypothetical protein